MAPKLLSHMLRSARLVDDIILHPVIATSSRIAPQKREEIDYPLHCDFKVYVVDGVSQVAKVTEE